MSSGTVFTYPENRLDFRSVKLLVTAKLSGKELKTEHVIFGDGDGGGKALPHKEFLQKFAFGKIPSLETDSGLCLGESNSAAYHLATEALRGGGDPNLRSSVLQWMNLAETQVLPPAHNLTFKRIGLIQVCPAPQCTSLQSRRAF